MSEKIENLGSSVEAENEWDIKGAEMPREEFENIYKELYKKYLESGKNNPFMVIFSMMLAEKDFRFGILYKKLEEEKAGEEEIQEKENIVVDYFIGNSNPFFRIKSFFDNNKREQAVEGLGLEDNGFLKAEYKEIFEREIDIEIFKAALEKYVREKNIDQTEKDLKERLKVDSVSLYTSLRNRLLDKLIEKYSKEKSAQ